MEYVTSERGKQKLVLEGYVYVKQKALSTGHISWECECRRHKGCKARLRVRGTDHLVNFPIRNILQNSGVTYWYPASYV